MTTLTFSAKQALEDFLAEILKNQDLDDKFCYTLEQEMEKFIDANS